MMVCGEHADWLLLRYMIMGFDGNSNIGIIYLLLYGMD